MRGIKLPLCLIIINILISIFHLGRMFFPKSQIAVIGIEIKILASANLILLWLFVLTLLILYGGVETEK